MESLTPIQYCRTVRSRWRALKKLCGGVALLHLYDPRVLRISLARAEAAQPGEKGSTGAPSIALTQDTTLPLKQGSLALSSEISSLTTLGSKQTDAVRLTEREKSQLNSTAWRRVPLTFSEFTHFAWLLTSSAPSLTRASSMRSGSDDTLGVSLYQWFMDIMAVCPVTLSKTLR